MVFLDYVFIIIGKIIFYNNVWIIIFVYCKCCYYNVFIVFILLILVLVLVDVFMYGMFYCLVCFCVFFMLMYCLFLRFVLFFINRNGIVLLFFICNICFL